MPGIRYTNGVQSLVIGDKAFGLGVTTIHGQKVELLALPSKSNHHDYGQRSEGEWTFAKAPAKFWDVYANREREWNEALADSEEALSGFAEDTEAGSFFLKEFIGKWAPIDWNNRSLDWPVDKPNVSAHDNPASIAEWLTGPNGVASRSFLRGAPVIKVYYQAYEGDRVFYLSAAKPYTLLRIESQPFSSTPAKDTWVGYDTAELLESEGNTLDLRLRREVGTLAKALEYGPGWQAKGEYGSCDAAGCTVRVTASAQGSDPVPRIGSQSWASVGKTIDTCESSRELASSYTRSSEITMRCRASGKDWRSWWVSASRVRKFYSMRVAVYSGVLSRETTDKLVAAFN